MEIFWNVMAWPMVACVALPGLLVYLGLHIVHRGVIFVDLALAQVATLGTCFCLMLGHDIHDVHTLYWSIAFTLGGALLFAFSRSHGRQRLPQEAVIGVVYVVAAAAAVLLLSRTPEGNEELRKTLIGDILTIQRAEVLKLGGLYCVIGAIHWFLRKRFHLLTFETDRCRAEGVSIRGWDFVFYALFGAVVTTFVQIGGVLLVFSYLIVPALCGMLGGRSFAGMFAVGWAMAAMGGAGGLAGSYWFDLPAGAAIVCTLACLLVMLGGVSWLRNFFGRNPEGRRESGPIK
ncbi:MAG: metal ABC transporter permease [Verrucomicrobia bacterium]|nr:metal ABC transporter permease [Verrucomicrobiota bacterium]